jgi:hypothetical protein
MMRKITDRQMATFEEHGWVSVPGLLPRERATELLDAAQRLVETVVSSEPDTSVDAPSRNGTPIPTYWKETTDWWAKWTGGFFQARHITVEPFASFEEQAKALIDPLMRAEGLVDRPIPRHFQSNALMCKHGLASGIPTAASEGIIPMHQDALGGSDGVRGFTIWIALDTITERHGSMRFLDRSHREGYLGKDQLGVHYSRLSKAYEWTTPMTYEPGDATIHHSSMVHGSTTNFVDTPRWSFSLHYSPDVVSSYNAA